jgi:serine/threonine-protein kinase RsbW
MRTAGFGDDQVLDMQLAIEEAITNTIQHGYRGNPGSVTIHTDVGPDLMIVEIADDAPGFDPLLVPKPDVTSALEDRDIGGLGVFLIRQVTDSVTYRYEQGKNVLTLMKKKQKCRA